jgi:hypothetical protein
MCWPIASDCCGGVPLERFIGHEQLQAASALYASKMRVPLSRLKRMEGTTYGRMLSNSKFCLCPTGDIASPGQRLYDAIAAGCVPIMIGVNAQSLPFARQVDYTKFAGFASRSSFLKDPVYTIETLIHRLLPKFAALQRAMMDARQQLLYGVLNDPSGEYAGYGNRSIAEPQATSEIATLLLRELALSVAFG